MAQEWKPPAWMYRGRRPPNDSAYYENMTRCIFQAGLSWRTVSDKWPAFQKAFDGFDVSKVAEYGAGDISRLMGDAGIIRNRRKILAAINNAREFERIAAEHGSFGGWLDSLDKSNNYDAVLKRLSSTFKHVGPTTAHIFLYTVGEDIKRVEE
jgi:DNA-3-methyladenine glycosylase I